MRIISRNGAVRALCCISTGLAREGCRRHGTMPTASVALGRALTGGALMGALLKTGQRVALRFEGNGPLGKILVEAQSNGAVCGYLANPEVDRRTADGQFDVAGAVGNAGLLTVTKDIGLKDPYQGTVILYTSEIGADLAYYLTDSEQTPSAVGLGVYLDNDGDVAAAGGFLIQAMPPQDDSTVEMLMGRIQSLPPLADLFRSGTTPEELLDTLFADLPYTILEKRELAFQCTCSRAKVEKALVSLGNDELVRLANEQNKAEVTCDFCRERYTFSSDELLALRTPTSH